MLRRDLPDALRGLRQSLAVTLTIVMCLGFGMGSVTLVYSWYEGLIERPLPAVASIEPIVTVRARASGTVFSSWPEYRDWRDRTTTLSGLSASTFSLFGVSFAGDADASSEPIYGIYATANYFRVLGVPITMGRDFRDTDDSPDRDELAVIISDRLWRGRLGGRPNVVGRSIQINGQPATIVGVAPPMFGGTMAGTSFDLWVPLASRRVLVPADARVGNCTSFRMAPRLWASLWVTNIALSG